MKKKSNDVQVNQLFDTIEAAGPPGEFGAVWLSDLRIRASRKRRGWKAELEKYLDWLTESKFLTIDEVAILRTSMSCCEEIRVHSGDFIAAFAWTSCAAASAVTS
ncbi:MAG TPA: hypothetical protein VK832_01765, partial [Burkholderiaceae bacterium]|nr:hypothetical protein [Burkholderiaceae bacterium]